MIKKYDAKHPDKKRKALWCCILGRYRDKRNVHAAHFFPYRYGQDTMDEVFGRGRTEEPELFSPSNGLLMDSGIEKKMDQGFLVIVPHLTNLNPETEVDAWYNSSVKSYKIKVLNPDGKGMKNHVLPDGLGNTMTF